jgi:hypothetical protein
MCSNVQPMIFVQVCDVRFFIIFQGDQIRNFKNWSFEKPDSGNSIILSLLTLSEYLLYLAFSRSISYRSVLFISICFLFVF